MRLLELLIVMLTALHESSAQSSLESLRVYELFRESLFNLSLPKPTNKTAYLRKLSERMQESVPVYKPFPCNTANSRSSSRPTSVDRLRPGDIDVVGGIGDSLTAAYGAEALILEQVLVENRGISWSIGGEKTWREFLTLPNILKEFNPKLVGYSYGNSLPHQKTSQFNVADGVAMSSDTHFQTRNLWKRMRGDKRVDYENDWKMVTMMIGHNDFCSNMCYEDRGAFLERHRRELTQTLDFLRDNMPRTLVNVIPPAHLEVLTKFTGQPPRCHLTHIFECPCLFGLSHRHRRQEFFETMRLWQLIEIEVVADDRYKNKSDFAVVVQPFTMNIEIPMTGKQDEGGTTDYTFLSPDCFHLSQKSHARAANAVWNNILEPLGQKTTVWYPIFSKFLCPTEEQPYIFTAANSDRQQKT